MIPIDPVRAVRDALASSEILREAERASAVVAAGVPLSEEQVARLKEQGNTSSDWSRVKVAAGFVADFVRGSHFGGDCLLGVFGAPVEVAPGVELPSGVYGSTLVDSAVESGAAVRDAKLVSRAFIGGGAVVMDVGEIVALAEASPGRGGSFGCGEEIPVGVESGGREVAMYPEITVPVAERIALARADEALQREYRDAVGEYARRLASAPRSVRSAAEAYPTWRTLIGRRARVVHVPFLRGVYLGECGCIDSASGVEDAAVLSSEDEPSRISTSACVARSVVQWGARIETGAVVEGSAILEAAHAAQGAKVAGSIIGPCSVVEKGEAISALVGPLVAQHHQSLLIAALWPGGRGNVAAGALVGSNHTGRSGDQEAHIGEGVFFGLGASVKYPADLSRAPHTIIAPGVPLPPQRIEFPFSLVREAGPELATRGEVLAGRPLPHEILPGWVLSEGAYSVARSERKHRDRYSARRAPLDPDPLRPEILVLVREARDRLRAVSSRRTYTGADVRGLGACVMTESARLGAVDAYTSALVRRSLLALWRRLAGSRSAAQSSPRGRSADEVARALSEEETDAAWTFHRSVLLEERPGGLEPPLVKGLIKGLLGELLAMQDEFARAVESSKAKDDARGERVIDGYADCRSSAAEDGHVRRTWEDVEALREDVSRFLDSLSSTGSLGGVTSKSR